MHERQPRRRFRLELGCARFHSGLRSAMRSAQALRFTPACRPPDRSSQAKSFRPEAPRNIANRPVRNQFSCESVNQSVLLSVYA